MPAPGASTSGQEETTSTALDPPEPIVDVEEAEPEVEEEPEPARKDAMTQCSIAIGMVRMFRSTGTQTTMSMISSMDRETQTGTASDQTLYEQCYSSQSSEDETNVSDQVSSQITAASCEADEPDWPQESESSSLGSETDIQSTQPHKEEKYIIFKSCLSPLLKHCLDCGGSVIDCEEATIGSLLSVKLFCINGHHNIWKSQPIINNTPAGNLLLSAATLFSGNTFSKISQFASFFNLAFLGKTTFYNMQSNCLLPAVDRAWMDEKSKVLNDAKVDGYINLNMMFGI